MKHDTQYDSDSFTHPDHPGWEFLAEHHVDNDHGAPWDEQDGHGPVRKARMPRYGHTHGTGKGAGEVVLHEQGGTMWIYDFKEAMKIAKRDGWGLSLQDDLKERERLVYRRMSSGMRNLCRGDELRALANCINLTPGQKREAAVRLDMKYLQRWLRNDWHWCGLVVKVVTCPPELADLVDEDAFHSVWGFESDGGDYLKDSALDMASALVDQMISQENLRAVYNQMLAQAQAAGEAAQRLEAMMFRSAT